MITTIDSRGAHRLLREARNWNEASPDEPLLSADSVLIIELVYAYERLQGASRASLDEQSDPEVKTAILADLCEGKLITETYEEGAVIPAGEWPGYKTENRSGFEFRFSTGRFFLHEGSERFEGKLPVIPLDAAIDWLIEKSKPQPKRRFDNKNS